MSTQVGIVGGSIVKHSTVKHSLVKHITVKHSTVKHSTVKHSLVKHSSVKHSLEKNSTVKHSSVKRWLSCLLLLWAVAGLEHGPQAWGQAASPLELENEALGRLPLTPERAVDDYLAAMQLRSPPDQPGDLIWLGTQLSRYFPGISQEPFGSPLELGTQQAEALELWCTYIMGLQGQLDYQLVQEEVDIPLSAQLLHLAFEGVERCLWASDDFRESLHSQLPADLLVYEWELYRAEGDQLGQLESLQARLELLPGDEPLALDAQFRLIELGHDLGDITDDGVAYDRLLSHPQLQNDEPSKLKLNLLISRAALALDREEPEKALPLLEQLRSLSMSDPEGRFDAFLPVTAAYLLWASLQQGALEEARLWQAELVDMAELVTLPRQRGFMRFAQGQLALVEGQHELAQQHFEQALAAGAREPELAWRARLGLAQVARARQQPDVAKQQLQAGIEQLDQQRRLLASVFWGLAYTSQRRGLYAEQLELLVDALPAGHPEQAAESMRDALLSLVEKRSALTLLARLAGEQGVGMSSGAGASTAPSVQLAQALVTGEALEGSALRALLPPGKRVFIFQPLKERILLLEVRREEVLPKLLPFGAAEQAALDGLLATFYGRPKGIPAELDVLGEMLLRPLLPSLPGLNEPVAFVLLGALEDVPLPALRIDGRYLVELTQPYELPSLLVSALLPTPLGGAPLSTLGVGYAPSLTRVTDALDLLNPSADPAAYQGRRLEGVVTVEQVLEALREPRGVLLFMTHGHKPVSAQRLETASGVVWLKGQQAGLVLSDGDLTPQHLAEVRVTGARVLLAACETRRGETTYQEHSQGSLHRAFLERGAASVLGSRWKVDENATFALLQGVLAELPSQGTLAALVMAQRQLLSGALNGSQPREAGQPALSAPWSWAAFSLVGRPE